MKLYKSSSEAILIVVFTMISKLIMIFLSYFSVLIVWFMSVGWPVGMHDLLALLNTNKV